MAFSIVFMARLRTAAGGSPLALRLRFRSWLRPVRRKWPPVRADSADGGAGPGANSRVFILGGFYFTEATPQTPPIPPQAPARRVGARAQLRSVFARLRTP